MSFLPSLSSLPFSLPIAGVVLAYQQSDGFGKFIVIMQLCFSAIALAVFIEKFKAFRKIAFFVGRFRNLFDSSADSLKLYNPNASTASLESNPAEAIYRVACSRVTEIMSPAGVESWRNNAPTVAGLADTEIDVIDTSIENTLLDQEGILESGMTILAVAVSASPLLGLFGTVWGVLNAFQSMGRSGSALLSDVAPGISSAMLTTVVGLFVAIPASIAYNVLGSKIKSIQNQLEGFADDLKSRIAFEFKQR